MVLGGELAFVGDATLPAVETRPGPFQSTTLSAWTRLDWRAGTTAVAHPPAYWGERFAAVLLARGEGFAVIDALEAQHRVFEVALPLASQLVVDGGWLRIRFQTGVLSLPCGALEHAELGPFEISAQVTYPRRDAGARLTTTLSWIYDNGDAIANVRRDRAFLDVRAFHLVKGEPFVLCDELWPNEFAAIEVPGQPRREFRPIETERTYAGVIVEGLPGHPLRHSIQPATLRTERFLPLLERLADDPDDDSTRSVLLDLMQDEGVLYAREIAEGLAAKRDVPLLGPLDKVFDRVRYRGGLPWFAQLRQRQPSDDALFELVGRDLRVGLLTTITRGNAAIADYLRVLEMPLAVGLRCVDSCNHDVLSALIDHHRGRVSSLSGVQLTKSSVRRLLANHTFDRVTELEAHISAGALREVLAEVARDSVGFYARSPRRLTIKTENGQHLDDIEPVLTAWPGLPVRALRVSWCALERRDGTTHFEIPQGAPPEIAARIRRAFER